ncbi:MAG: hypothetical protein JST58_06810 [Bacteroidetes bacterium]|nr:hypothetical protein [Bacteroidota bacterium]
MKTKILLSSMAFIACIGMSTVSFAQDGRLAENHQRHDQVNDRLANQHARIHDKLEDGRMSRNDSYRLHREDHGIRMEERGMASRDNGHINNYDQHRLNRQENHVSRQIKRH